MRRGLLEDLLEHVVRELAPLGGLGAELERADLTRAVSSLRLVELEVVRGEGHDVVVVEVDDLSRVRDDGGGVAGQEVLALADADDEWRTAPGADHDAGDRRRPRRCRRCR